MAEVPGGHVPDEVYEWAREQITDKGLVNLTLAVVAINGWNTLAIGFRTVSATNKLRGEPQGVKIGER